MWLSEILSSETPACKERVIARFEGDSSREVTTSGISTEEETLGEGYIEGCGILCYLEEGMAINGLTRLFKEEELQTHLTAA